MSSLPALLSHLTALLRLDSGCGDRIDDIVDRAAARKVVAGFSKALKHRETLRAADPLRDFITNISGLKIREYENIRAAGNR